MPQPNTRLAGKRILVVEDEYLIADDLRRTFEDGGAEIVGPAGTLDEALQLASAGGRLDGAVLDINLHGELVYPVADELAKRGVPFVFVTGYEAGALPPRFAHAAHCEKPLAGLHRVIAALA